MKQQKIVKKFFIIIAVFVLCFAGCTLNYNYYYEKDTNSNEPNNTQSPNGGIPATWLTNARDKNGVELKNTSFGRFWKVNFHTGHANNPDTYTLQTGENFINSPRYLAFNGIIGYLNYYNYGPNGIFRSVYEGLEKRVENAFTPFLNNEFTYCFFEKMTSTNINIDGKYHIFPSNLYINFKTSNDVLINTYLDSSEYNHFIDFIVVCMNKNNKHEGYMFEIKRALPSIPSNELKISELLQSYINAKLGSQYSAKEFIEALLKEHDIYIIVRNTRNDNIQFLYNTDRNFCYRNVVKVTDEKFK